MERIRILIVEDNEGDTRLIREMLKAWPGEKAVSTASTLQEAERHLERGIFDLVLLDLNLPDREGVEVIGAVAKHAGRSTIIVLTGMEDDSLGAEALLRGAQDFLVKGRFDAKLLRRTCRQGMERKRILDELEAYRDYLAGTVQERTTELMDLDRQLQRQVRERVKVQQQNELTAKLLKLFMKRFSHQEYLNDVVTIVANWTNCPAVGIRIIDPRGATIHQAQTGYDPDFWNHEGFLSLLSDRCACTRIVSGSPAPQDSLALTAAGSFACGDVAALADGLAEDEQHLFRGVCLKAGFGSVAAVPIRFGEEVFGAIHLGHPDKDGINPEQVESLEYVTPIVAEAIHRFNMELEIRTRHRSLQIANELLEAIFSDITMKIAVLDAELRFVRVNRAYAEATHRETTFFPGKGYFELFPDLDKRQNFQRVLSSGEPYIGLEEPFLFPDTNGTMPSYWDWSIQRLKNVSGENPGLLLILRNVTERKIAQEQVIRQGQLACLGELAAGVAHEVNNPITGIINYAQIILDEYGDGSRAGDISQRIIKEGDRVARIVRSLLAFAREERRERGPVRISELMAETFGLASQSLEHDRIRVTVDIEKTLPPVLVNTSEIGQVFLNLLSNARHALNERYPTTHDNKVLEIHARRASCPHKDQVSVTFTDHGTGIPAAILENVTKPFYTTKNSRHGTGLGLSISERIVDEHGGRLRISSVENESTTVEVLLPCATGGDR